MSFRQSDHRLPRLYNEAAKILKEVLISKRGLKDVIYSNRNRILHTKFLGLLNKYFDNQNVINKFITETNLTDFISDIYIVRILCTELMYGKKCLPEIVNNKICKIKEIFDKNSRFTDYHIANLDNTNIDNNNDTNSIKIKKKIRYVRINTLMTDKYQLIDRLTQDGFIQLPNANSYDEFIDIIKDYTSGGVDRPNDEAYFIEDFHLNDVLVFLQSTHFTHCSYYRNGLIFLQDKASCIPTHLLAPPPNSVVFDTCAAPGNKTLHLAAFMQNQGKIYAVDKDPKRFKYLQEVVKLAQGDQIIKTIQSDIFQIRMADYRDVEYVLVDPSCSGTGISERQKIDNNQSICQSRINSLSGFQKDLLNRVCLYFPNVKRILYCTCSIREEENEQVVEDVIAKHGNKFQVEDLKQHPTLREWKNYGNSNYKNGNKCFYAKSNDYCTGFFAALLIRKNKNVDHYQIENRNEDNRNIRTDFVDDIEIDGEKTDNPCHKDPNYVETPMDDFVDVENKDEIKKKMKKKRKNDLENCSNEGGIEVCNTENTSVVENDKKEEKIKKRRKKNKGDEDNSSIQTIGDHFVEETYDKLEKKKKKSKKDKVREVNTDVINYVDNIGDSFVETNNEIKETFKKKKKSRKNDLGDRVDDEVSVCDLNADVEEMHEVSKSTIKKKKKTKNDLIDISYGVSDNVQNLAVEQMHEDSESPIKKKKKKKRHGHTDDDIKNSIQGSFEDITNEGRKEKRTKKF